LACIFLPQTIGADNHEKKAECFFHLTGFLPRNYLILIRSKRQLTSY
jgi:hypothetical protein